MWGRSGVSAERPVKGETQSEMSNQSDVLLNNDVSADLAEPTVGGDEGIKGDSGGVAKVSCFYWLSLISHFSP